MSHRACARLAPPCALLTCALLTASCHCFPGTFSDYPPRSGRFAELGTHPVSLLLGLPGPSGGDQARVPLRAEPSGSRETLLAVVLDEDAAYAAGTQGVVLRRGLHEPWQRERSGTDRTLRALAVAVGFRVWFSDRDEREDAPIFAVGDEGTVLRRSLAGTWRAEPSGTKRDLHAVSTAGERVLAAGERGTLIARRAEGIWYDIPTHTEADLRGIALSDRGQLLLDGGDTVITCGPWKDGADLQSVCAPPLAPDPAAVHAFAALVTTGPRGALQLRDDHGSSPLALPSAPDLRAGVANGRDAFVVGDRGAILHARIGHEVELYAVQQ